jgi:hypothetical protein
VNVSVVPESVPVSVLFATTVLLGTVVLKGPVTALPDCESVPETVPGPDESDPVPFQEPLKLIAVAVGEVVDVLLPPHAHERRRSAAIEGRR